MRNKLGIASNNSLKLQKILTLILCNNYFKFNNEYYLQTHGTAMGSPLAPSYAKLPIFSWVNLKQHILQNARGGLIPLEWIRFVDHIFAIWPETEWRKRNGGIGDKTRNGGIEDKTRNCSNGGIGIKRGMAPMVEKGIKRGMVPMAE